MCLYLLFVYFHLLLVQSVDKFLYKIPAGTYKVTTDNEKTTSFNIVKDNIKINKDEKYPEELDYVQNYLITKNQDQQIELKEDESIQIIDKDTIKLKKVVK